MWRKGLKGKKVIYIHALKNALLPVITLMGLRMGGMLGGSVFVIPGMGSLLVNAISMQDIPLIQGCVLLIALFTSVVKYAGHAGDSAGAGCGGSSSPPNAAAVNVSTAERSMSSWNRTAIVSSSTAHTSVRVNTRMQ